MSIFKKSIVTALAFFSLIGQANAGLITYNFNTPQAGSLLETFDELPLGSHSGTFSLPGILGQLSLNNSEIVQGTITTLHAAPYLDTTPYVSIYANGSAVLSLTHPSKYFGIDWGSVDTYNTLSFYNGKTLIGSIPGQTIIAAANLQAGNQGAFGSVYANFASTEAFTKVVASSTGIAFEFDNVRVSAVPLPASLPLFLAAMLGLGMIGSRYRKKLIAGA